MSDETKNMIDAVTNNDGTAFKAGFDAAINQKVGDALQAQRQDIAKNIFGNVRVPTQNEEVVDEGSKLPPDETRGLFKRVEKIRQKALKKSTKKEETSAEGN